MLIVLCVGVYFSEISLNWYFMTFWRRGNTGSGFFVNARWAKQVWHNGT